MMYDLVPDNWTAFLFSAIALTSLTLLLVAFFRNSGPKLIPASGPTKVPPSRTGHATTSPDQAPSSVLLARDTATSIPSAVQNPTHQSSGVSSRPINFSFDPMSMIDRDAAQTSAEADISDHVEFFVLGPGSIGANQSFRIFVNIQKTANTGGGDDSETFDSIIAEVQRGSRLSLVLECYLLGTPPVRFRVDAPYQALTWRGSDLVADFVLRSPPVATPTMLHGCLWLSIGHHLAGSASLLPKAKIDINILVVPKLPTQAPSRLSFLWGQKKSDRKLRHIEVQDKWQISQYVGVGVNALAIADAAIVYSHADEEVVRRYVSALEASNVRCRRDHEEFKPVEYWEVQMERVIADASTVLIFWSKTASESPAIQKELRKIDSIRTERQVAFNAYLARMERSRPGDRNDRPERRQQIVFVVPLKSDAPPLPDWFKDSTGYSTAPIRLRSGSYPQ